MRPYAGRPGSQAGLSLIEILVVVAMIGMVAVVAMEAWLTWAPRATLRRATRELTQTIQKARIAAIQRAVPTVVSVDLATDSVLAFADVNGDPVPASPGFPRYLRFDPDAGVPGSRTDYRVAGMELSRVAFGGPVDGQGGEDSFAGLTAIPGEPPATPPVLVFRPDGTPLDGGAFRVLGGDGRNVFEVAVEGVTGRVEVRKYLHAADAPGGVAGFFPEARTSTGVRLWTWY